MKTKDSISKKRQKLRQEIEYWQARERESRAGLALTTEDRTARSKAVLFCRQEIAEREKGLKKLETGSRWQVINGWK
jgi:hypothetical protein